MHNHNHSPEANNQPSFSNQHARHGQMHGHGHGHGHGHNHGNSHSHGHQGCSHHHEVQISPQQYFEKIAQMKRKQQYQFYWMEILKGTYMQKKLQTTIFNSLASLNCQVLMGIIGMFHMMLNFEWIPIRARPFTSGLFFPLIILTILNYHILVGFNNNNSERHANVFIIFAPLILYSLVGLRGAGSLSTTDNQKKSRRSIEIRPYLQSPPLQCAQCKILKVFRSMHCPMCKICIPKFSRHSLVFGSCIGASNELLAMLFFMSTILFGAYSVLKFWSLESSGMITKIMFYSINCYICWASIYECLNFMILNFYYGITEFEVQAWVMFQYLMNVPQRTFKNTCNQGLKHNLTQAVYALFGIPGFQFSFQQSKQDRDDMSPLNQQITNDNNMLGFPQLDQSKKYIVNWAQAFFYLIPMMPNHPLRQKVMSLMQKQEPRMIDNFRMMKQFKDEAHKQNPLATDLQKQQKAMMKMQQHMMKNPPEHMKPSPEQQKMIQLQMLGHLKQQFRDNVQLFSEFQQIQSNLKSNQISSEQASVKLRQLQQKVMQIKMNHILEQQQKNIESQKSQSSKKNQLVSQKQETSLLDATDEITQPIPQKPQNQKSQHVQPPRNMNSPQPQFMMPSNEQKKTMMLTAISNMTIQVKDDQNLIAQLNKAKNKLEQEDQKMQEAEMILKGVHQQIMRKKMQEMAARNPNGAGMNPMMMPPSPQKQKQMMLMGIGRMKQQFASNQLIVTQLSSIQTNLQEDKMSLEEAGSAMRGMQQEIMKAMQQNSSNSFHKVQKKELIDDQEH